MNEKKKKKKTITKFQSRGFTISSEVPIPVVVSKSIQEPLKGLV